ncbi:FAD-dependent hydroxylase [Stagnimonas aquatica]|uniref:FAD-dependent hydroxylase n=1 Tax=Stagnimonas aquatica TaxID=2689987 RepID=A0A3N0VLJ4_9GAMM|nr:5-demethoxyubiquinol-8 5-hydroxylase UbiM [Stagnimonas aquatica]ROH93584.1 FAD-dependent hydroxylase [Stagnimonas aquatica]
MSLDEHRRPTSAAAADGAPASAPDDAEVLIVGAGPAGLSLACALAQQGLRVKLLERQPRAALAEAAPDGREIALTHRGVDILERLGIWARIPRDEVSTIREARVLNGASPRALHFDSREAGTGGLGFLVPNHVIRRAAYATAVAQAGVEILDGVQPRKLVVDEEAAQVELADGRQLRARLLVAADSRLSDSRRQLGIGADLRDFGRDVIVCHLGHALPHQGIAYECFGHGRTLAMLPLTGNRVSAVLTAPSEEAERLRRLPPAEYARLLSEQFGGRLGAMQLLGERHSYPLVAVYAQQFVGQRCALIGDAAVGMHPVTAHGFNLGLYGVDALSRALASAHREGLDLGAGRVLARYQSEHRRATAALYHGTNLLVGLYTDERPPARFAREALLGVANRLPPLKSAITRQLTGRGQELSWAPGRRLSK